MLSTSPITRFSARVAPDTLALLKRAAEIHGRSLNDFIVSTAYEEACRVLAQNELANERTGKPA